jgi:anion-transporting  ArsA/GET3 family ATPase
VTIPEALAVQQISGIMDEFSRHGFEFSEVIINNVIISPDSDFLKLKSDQQQGYIERIQTMCKGRKIKQLPLFPYEIMGMEKLKEIATKLFNDKRD